MERQRTPHLMTGAEPFFYPGNEVGCLVLHGLCASPAEVRWLGEDLAAQGYTVYGPRLAGHGTDYREMAHIHWHDWYLSVLDGYALLRSQCQQVFVLGLSMGGLLGLMLAAAEPIDGLVVMGSPLKLPNERLLALTGLIRYVRPFVDAPDRSDFPLRLMDEQKRRGEPALGRVRYDRWASRGVEMFYALMRAVDTHLPGVTEPTLLIYSQADETVPFENMDYLRKRIGSTLIETCVLEKSGHILTQDREHAEVFRRAAAFISQLTHKNA
ncbi:MAG: carboxylesterase [Anaerolineae bacterium]